MSQVTRRTRFFGIDNDTKDYVKAVLDNGGSISFGVVQKVDRFVKDCKKYGIWGSLVDVGLLAGPDNLNGALVKLKYAAGTPRILTNVNFVEGDYNSRTGLIGNGSSKYLDTNRRTESDPVNNHHISLFISSPRSSLVTLQEMMGEGSANSSGSTRVASSNSEITIRDRSVDGFSLVTSANIFTGFLGSSRNNQSNYSVRISNTNNLFAASSSTPPANHNYNIFRSNNGSLNPTNARISFYSIGFDINLEILDTLVTNYNNSL